MWISIPSFSLLFSDWFIYFHTSTWLEIINLINEYLPTIWYSIELTLIPFLILLTVLMDSIDEITIWLEFQMEQDLQYDEYVILYKSLFYFLIGLS